VGLRTNHTARGKHAHVGSGRNMPGTQGKYLSTLKLCDIVSHANMSFTGRAPSNFNERNTLYRAGRWKLS